MAPGSPWVTVTAVLVGLLILVTWLSAPTYKSTEPEPVRHWIPILGHAISLAKDRRSFFQWADLKNGQKPFSVFVAGRKHYVFSRPSEVAALYRKSKALNIAVLLRLMNVTLFGYSEKDSKAVMDLSEPMHATHHKHLLQAENYNVTAARYYAELHTLVQNVAAEIDDSETKSIQRDGLRAIMNIMGKAATVAYYGHKLFELNPSLLIELGDFVEKGFWPLLFGTPRFLMKKTYKIRDSIITNLMDFFDVVDDQDDVSGFIMERIRLAGPSLSKEGLAASEFSLLFGLNTNSVPTGYIALLEILSNPGLIDEMRAELDNAGCIPGQIIDFMSLTPASFPRLRAVFFETLRVHSNSLSIREVLEDTEVTARSSSDEGQSTYYTLEKGAIVNMPASLLHMNEIVYQNPRKFDHKRFLDPSLGGEGVNPANGLRAFGGGTSYCPGRVFAEKQIVSFLALMILNFDIKALEDSWSVPPNADFEATAKWPRVHLEISRRLI